MLAHICTHSHAHTWSVMLTHAHLLIFMLRHSYSCIHAHTLTCSCSHTCYTHAHTFVLIHMHIHSWSYMCTLMLTHSCHTCLHTHVHIRTGSHTHTLVVTHAHTFMCSHPCSHTQMLTHVHTLAHTHSCLHTHHTVACFSRCPCHFLSWRALYREPLTSQPSPWPPCGLCGFLPLKNLPRCQCLGSSLTPLTLFILPCWVLFLSLSISPPQHSMHFGFQARSLSVTPRPSVGSWSRAELGVPGRGTGLMPPRLFVVLGWRRWKKCARRLLDSVLSFCFPSTSCAGGSFMSPRLVSWQTPSFRGSVLSLAAGVREGQLQRVSRAYAFHNTPASDTPRSAFLPEPLPLQNSTSNKKTQRR